MAGESPDRSERERSSGETTAESASVPPEPSRDPREAFAQARTRDDNAEREAAADGTVDDDGTTEGVGTSTGTDTDEQEPAEQPATEESEEPEESAAASEEPEPAGTGEAGDARLRAAVAAWVSGSEPEDGPAPSEAPDRSATPAEPNDERGADENTAAEGGDLPVRPRPAAPDEDGPPPATDTPTTVFGTRADDATSFDEESAAARAERMTAAFFGSPRRTASSDDASSERSKTDASDASDSSDTASDSSEEVPAADSAGAPEPVAAEAADSVSGGAERAGSTGDDAPGAASDTADTADAEGADAAEDVEETADAAEPGAEPTRAEAPGRPAQEADGARTAEATPDDGDADASAEDKSAGASASDAPPTEREKSDPAEPEAGAGPQDHGTTVLRRAAPKTEAEPKTEAPPKAGSATIDQPTTALRVPKGRDAADDAPSAAEATAAVQPKTPAEGDAPHDGAAGEPGTETDTETGKATEGDEPAAANASPAGEKPAETVRRAPVAGSPRAGTDGPEEQPAGAGESRFVPLRTGDEPRTPGALPDEAPTVGGEQERTKQQPVPDTPPLELLAQLTNTPPPPETPLRVAVRRVKIWTPLVVVLAIVFMIVQALRPLPDPTLTLTAKPAHTFDGAKPTLPWPQEGQSHLEVSGLGVLGSSGEQKPVPIGSVAKTMTAYVVLKDKPLEEGEDGPELTIDEKAEEDGKRGAGNGDESVLDGVRAGDRITLREAISALMIPSANNIARLLARWHSGSESAFVQKMNQAAEDLGMEKTTYTDPSGLSDTTVSTAADQVKLGKEVAEMPELMAITKLPSWKNPFTGDQMRNWNELVPFDGAIGIKTGTTTAAGGNLLFAGHREVGGTTQVIVGAVLGQHTPPIIDTVNAVSRQLLIAAGDSLTDETIVRKGDVVGHVDDGLGGRTPVVATEDVRAVGYGGVRVELALRPGKDGIPHSATSGDTVGVLTVGGGPGKVEVPVALQRDLTEPEFGDKLTRIL